MAQTYYVETSPATLKDGDTVRLDFFAGTAANPYENVTQLAMEATCEGCTFAEGSSSATELIDPSWFADDSYWSSTVTFSSNREKLFLTLTRESGSRTGYGYVASAGGGIVVEIEDISKASPQIRLSQLQVRQEMSWQFARGRLEVTAEAPGLPFALLDAQGRQLGHSQTGTPLPLPGLPGGIYLIRLDSPQGVQIRKWGYRGE